MVSRPVALHRPRVGGSTTGSSITMETNTGLHRPCAGGTTIEGWRRGVARSCQSLLPPAQGRWGARGFERCRLVASSHRFHRRGVGGDQWNTNKRDENWTRWMARRPKRSSIEYAHLRAEIRWHFSPSAQIQSPPETALVHHVQ